MSIRDGSRAAYRAVFLPGLVCHRIYSAFCCEVGTPSQGEKVSIDPVEWKSGDQLPGGFSEWLRGVVREQEIEQRKGFSRIAGELGVSEDEAVESLKKHFNIENFNSKTNRS